MSFPAIVSIRINSLTDILQLGNVYQVTILSRAHERSESYKIVDASSKVIKNANSPR